MSLRLSWSSCALQGASVSAVESVRALLIVRCKHVKAVTLQRLRGDAAAASAGVELVRYLRAVGVAGDADEILATIRARLAQVESASKTYGGWTSWIPSLDFRASSYRSIS